MPEPIAGSGRPTALAAALAAVPPLGASLLALHPGVPAGDSGELITVAATAGVAHPPGYPLWTMLAGAFARLVPAGTVAWRLNLLSALFAAAAAAVLAVAVHRASRSPAAAVLAGWAFAFSVPAFRYALVAEVFSLNALLAACVLLALTSAPARSAVALAFLVTLALSHHHTLLVLALPALLVQAVRAFRERAVAGERARLAARMAAAAALGLLPLLWLPIAATRAQALVWGDAGSLRGFLALLLRAEYGTLRLDAADAGYTAHAGYLAIFARSLPSGLGYPAVALAVAGAVALALRHRPAGLALAGYAVGQVWFFTRIGFPTDVSLMQGVVERFYVLPLLVLGFGAGVGAAWLLDRIGPRGLRGAGAVLLLALTTVPAAGRVRDLTERGNHFAESLGRGILASLPPNAVLFVQGDVLEYALQYLTRVERLRPDVTVLDQELMTYAWYLRRVRAADPSLLPPFTRAQRIRLADGRALEGLAIPREDGTTDVLAEEGQGTLPSAQIAQAEAASPGSLYASTRAGFRRDLLLEESDDRYSGLPGTRNLLWLDHLAGKRPVALLGLKEDSYALRYDLTPFGLVNLAHRRAAPPAPGERLAAALRAAEGSDPDVYFRRYAPTSFEEAERPRFAELVTFTEPLLCQRSAGEVVAAHRAGHDRLLSFARRFELLEPTPDPDCLRAIGLLRLCDPALRDPVLARSDLQRALARNPNAGSDTEAQRVLQALGAAPEQSGK